MAGESMYETLMSLPLFKGISAEKVSALLEKIPLEFRQITKGETLAGRGEACDSLQFLLTGEALVSRSLFRGRLVMEQRVGKGAVFMPENLCGLYTDYNADVTAYTAVGVMAISKPRYMDILEMDRVYLVNMLNYLSYKCQVRSRIIGEFSPAGLSDFCSELWRGMGDRKALSTTFQADKRVFALLAGLSEEAFEEQMRELTASGVASATTDGDRVRLTLHRLEE